MRQKVIILGITGSVGDSALKVLRKFPEKFELVAFSYHSNHTLAYAVAQEFKVKHICCTSNSGGDVWDSSITLYHDMEDLLDCDYDSVLISVVGAVGVKPTYKAALSGKKIMLANKEALVMAGDVIMPTARRSGSEIIPVDSEHNSVFRLLKACPDYAAIILTASGGPFRSASVAEIRHVSKAQVLKHPTWEMGQKITVDSAGMINKSLEIIEAHHLFSVGYERLSAVIHPQSYIHAIVEHRDGSYFFHVSQPDMIFPVAHALFYPEEPLLTQNTRTVETFPDLQFSQVDREKFPGFFLGIESGKKGGCYPAVFNAANEEAVALFLKEQIPFYCIPEKIEAALSASPFTSTECEFETLFQADAWARSFVRALK